jgi:hypothetical protein
VGVYSVLGQLTRFEKLYVRLCKGLLTQKLYNRDLEFVRIPRVQNRNVPSLNVRIRTAEFRPVIRLRILVLQMWNL